MKGLDKMGLKAYLYKVKMKVYRFLNLNRHLALTKEQMKLHREFEEVEKSALKIKRSKAAKEVQNIKLFTHWPISKPRNRSSNASLVYLDTSKKKHSGIKQHATEKTFNQLDKKITRFDKNIYEPSANKDKKIT